MRRAWQRRQAEQAEPLARPWPGDQTARGRARCDWSA